jgi:hypothetical protein
MLTLSILLCGFSKEHADTCPCNSNKFKISFAEGFAKVRYEDEKIQDCESFFKHINMFTRSERNFANGPEYVNFDMFIENNSPLN